MKLRFGWINYDPKLGVEVKDILSEALALAKLHQANLHFRLTGAEFCVGPNDELPVLLAAWEKYTKEN